MQPLKCWVFPLESIEVDSRGEPIKKHFKGFIMKYLIATMAFISITVFAKGYTHSSGLVDSLENHNQNISVMLDQLEKQQ